MEQWAVDVPAFGRRMAVMSAGCFALLGWPPARDIPPRRFAAEFPESH